MPFAKYLNGKPVCIRICRQKVRTNIIKRIQNNLILFTFVCLKLSTHRSYQHTHRIQYTPHYTHTRHASHKERMFKCVVRFYDRVCINVMLTDFYLTLLRSTISIHLIKNNFQFFKVQNFAKFQREKHSNDSSTDSNCIFRKS